MKVNKFISTSVISIVSIITVGASFAQEPVWDGNKVVLQSEKLADGVFAYYPENAKEFEKEGKAVATSGGFIIGDKSVLMIDTMLNKRLYQQAESLIKKQTTLPISFAVNTSFHGDHSYGNMYLPSQTQIIQHINTKNYIDEHFEKDAQFMIANFGKGRGIEEIKPVSANILLPEEGRLTLDLGNKYVEIIDFGFAQTGGDLFVWEPESKTMWTGNPIITMAPSLPWLLDGHLLETLETLKEVYHFLPEDAKVVPGHGSVIKRSDIKWHIDYLEAVKSEVQKALNAGLTLEETVQQVKLPEFSGYSLFNWVHPDLNVPAAYKDLKQ
ncbi:MBL fold metallo-hydrolase [Vibrio sp. NTOU-M3]|uniref:MBL fold metallo-hydrolase n=1 Tax=Vibrio sp. NTOU-M3 TaxID=3234954 RepID=UPI00349F77A0